MNFFINSSFSHRGEDIAHQLISIKNRRLRLASDEFPPLTDLDLFKPYKESLHRRKYRVGGFVFICIKEHARKIQNMKMQLRKF